MAHRASVAASRADIPHVRRSGSHVGVEHGTQGNPPHIRKVFVEHSSGEFIPQNVFTRIEKEETKRDKILTAITDAIVFWDTTGDDASTYEPFLNSAVLFFRRMMELLAGFCAGFSFFLLMSVYFRPSTREKSTFLPHYADYYQTSQKIFLATSLLLVVLSLSHFAIELSMSRRREEARAKLLSAGITQTASANAVGASFAGPLSGPRREAPAPADPASEDEHTHQLLALASGESSPWMLLLNVHFLIYLGVLIMTIVEHSAEQGRNPTEILALDGSPLTRLHVAIIIRAILHFLGWLSFLGSPLQ